MSSRRADGGVVDRRRLVDVIKSGCYAVCWAESLLTRACLIDPTDMGALNAAKACVTHSIWLFFWNVFDFDFDVWRSHFKCRTVYRYHDSDYSIFNVVPQCAIQYHMYHTHAVQIVPFIQFYCYLYDVGPHRSIDLWKLSYFCIIRNLKTFKKKLALVAYDVITHNHYPHQRWILLNDHGDCGTFRCPKACSVGQNPQSGPRHVS